MTGRYSWRQGFYFVGGQGQAVNESFTMLPQVLKQGAGYHTVAVGKWHLGYLLKQYTPTMRGFDRYLGYYNAALSDYWYHGKADASCAGGWSTDLSNNTGTRISGATGTNGTYSTRLFTSYAVDAITDHFATDASTPLYMYLAHEAVHAASGTVPVTGVHAGIQAPLSTVEQYDSIYPNDTYKVTAAATTELDWSISNVTAALKQVGVWNSTVFLFVTDNGGPLDHAINFPLRGGKHTYCKL